MTPDAGYRRLADVYDRWQAGYGADYSSRIFPRILATVKEHGVQPGSALDVGCGTGTLAFLLEEQGWQVAGIDASEGMVRAAKEKALTRGSHCTFAVQDVRELNRAAQATLAVSVYDVLNHVEGNDLVRAFRAIKQCLLPDGLLIFDLNNRRCFERLWTRDELMENEDFSMVLRNSYDAPAGLATSEVLVRFKQGGEEFREQVVEYCHSRNHVREVLDAAGFTVLDEEDFAFPGNTWAGKLKTWWIASSRGKD
jgi:2-polyprenyl-3-methyl-5-hydroxy-6-metoxy-1,4-benzoquinol methylase